jgi:hypothetical protein
LKRINASSSLGEVVLFIVKINAELSFRLLVKEVTTLYNMQHQNILKQNFNGAEVKSQVQSIVEKMKTERDKLQVRFSFGDTILDLLKLGDRYFWTCP